MHVFRLSVHLTKAVAEAAVGAGMAYLFDPLQGAERRARAAHLARDVARDTLAQRRSGGKVITVEPVRISTSAPQGTTSSKS